jgi:pimeloyl-ACP methyl ester carboxylesterase
MCAAMNAVQARHRLHANSRAEVERYVERCEKLTLEEFYAVEPVQHPGSSIEHPASSAPRSHSDSSDSALDWPSPVQTPFRENNTVHVDLFPCARGWNAPTVLMLHALMSASDIGYRRWAKQFNAIGWNACFVHLPFHYSRRPRGFWNGELAIGADVIRTAEGLRQGVIELRQLMQTLRERGCAEFALWATSYGGWIGALLSFVERDFRFIALMAPIVDVEHAIWESPAAVRLRAELRRAGIDHALVERHFHLTSPMHNEPLCGGGRVLFAAGEYDLIALPEHIERLHRQWAGSSLLRVAQGHFGYRMMRETFARLEKQRVF